MNARQKIEQLQSEIEVLKRQIANCHHDDFTNVKYDPEIKQVPSGYKLVTHGSDAWGYPTGYCEQSIPRWSRECKKCGYIEYTTEQKAIKFEPHFK